MFCAAGGSSGDAGPDVPGSILVSSFEVSEEERTEVVRATRLTELRHEVLTSIQARYHLLERTYLETAAIVIPLSYHSGGMDELPSRYLLA